MGALRGTAGARRQAARRQRGRVESATRRATEALGYATLLERATELLLANGVLSHECSVTGDRKGAARFAKEVERVRLLGAAAWTHDIAALLWR